MNKKLFKKNSLVQRFIFLMSVFIAAFLILAVILLYSFYDLNKTYTSKNSELEKKERIVQKISEDFNMVFMGVRGYIAYGNKELKKEALAKEPEIRERTRQFKEMAVDDQDREFLNQIELFTDYYFVTTLPKAIEDYENGNYEAVVERANTGATYKVDSMKKEIRDYISEKDKQIDENFQELSKMQSYVQIGFVSFILVFLIVLLRITRIMFSEIARPLASFAFAANEIASGRDAVIEMDSERNDELGVLSVAFNRMVASIQENEQNLLAQNEELLAQQDELHAQQLELEEALEIVKGNESRLNSRNELVNKIANSLDKQEVLESVVMNMCPIIGAEKGIIAFIDDDSYASYGISPDGVKQFRSNLLFSGIVERLQMDRKPFILKRDSRQDEKGFHTNMLNAHDLYLPIFLSGKKLIAVMAFSRSDTPFELRKMEEYEALAKNIGIALDKISLYQKSEEARRLNQDILDTIQEGVQLINTDGTILQVNKQFCEMFGCPDRLQKMGGCSWEEWTGLLSSHIEESEEFIDFLRKEVSSLDRFSFSDRHYVYKSNSGLVYKVYCEGLFHGNAKLGTIFVHRNITKEFEVDRIKSEFVSTVSHELRTPLASILGFTELIMTRELKPDRQKKYLTTIYNEAGRLTALINDFLDIQRMEAGKQCYESKEIQLLPIIKKVMDLQKVHSDKHELILDFAGGSDRVIGDREKMEQAITNLVHNAIKYSPDGGEVRVAVYEKNGLVNIEIKDEGLGVPPESMDKLFEKFFRVDNSDRRSIGGTGLGLAIVKEIIQVHGGEIKVDSEYGKGSTFTVSLPVQAAILSSIEI
ncbi:ATP-binding protein [Heyndrickxia sp. MSNUG]|uniref:ATP-binding protein n=1 Tax=Heyndrickxia sp. MSNUG TaxID=3136677 RepID=UPI003C301EC2